MPWNEAVGAKCDVIRVRHSIDMSDAEFELIHDLLSPAKARGPFWIAWRIFQRRDQANLSADRRPVAFYSDKHSVFRVAKTEAHGGQSMTQFGRALAELNIEILCANSSQAKGRVERVNRTLQDRLAKALRLARISDREAGNEFLPGFMASFNERFATPATRPQDGHRPLNVEPGHLRTCCAGVSNAM